MRRSVKRRLQNETVSLSLANLFCENLHVYVPEVNVVASVTEVVVGTVVELDGESVVEVCGEFVDAIELVSAAGLEVSMLVSGASTKWD